MSLLLDSQMPAKTSGLCFFGRYLNPHYMSPTALRVQAGRALQSAPLKWLLWGSLLSQVDSAFGTGKEVAQEPLRCLD